MTVWSLHLGINGDKPVGIIKLLFFTLLWINVQFFALLETIFVVHGLNKCLFTCGVHLMILPQCAGTNLSINTLLFRLISPAVIAHVFLEFTILPCSPSWLWHWDEK